MEQLSYSRAAEGLSQQEAMANLRAVFASDYFQGYLLHEGRIGSDMITVSHLGGFIMPTNEKYTVGTLADTVLGLLDQIEDNCELIEAHIRIGPTQERLRAMQFEEHLYEAEIELPLLISIRHPRDAGYTFSVLNFGIKEPSADTNRKLAAWYDEVQRNLEEILPHPVNAPGLI